MLKGGCNFFVNGGRFEVDVREKSESCGTCVRGLSVCRGNSGVELESYWPKLEGVVYGCQWAAALGEGINGGW